MLLSKSNHALCKVWMVDQRGIGNSFTDNKAFVLDDLMSWILVEALLSVQSVLKQDEHRTPLVAGTHEKWYHFLNAAKLAEILPHLLKPELRRYFSNKNTILPRMHRGVTQRLAKASSQIGILTRITGHSNTVALAVGQEIR